MAISRSTGLPGLPNRGAPPFLGACGFPAAGGFTAPPGRATLRGGGGALAGLGPAFWAHIPTAAISSATATAWQLCLIGLELRVRAIRAHVMAELAQHIHRVQRPLHLFRLHRFHLRQIVGRQHGRNRGPLQHDPRHHQQANHSRGGQTAPQRDWPEQRAPPGCLRFNPPVEPAVEIRGNRRRLPAIQRFPDRALALGEFPAGSTPGDMTFQGDHLLRFQFAGAIIQQQLRVLPSLQWAVHTNLTFTPYAPGARAGFRKRGTAAILPPIPNNSKPLRFANTPILRICASALPLSVWRAAPQWPSGSHPSWPRTPWTAPPTAGGRKPAWPARRWYRHPISPATVRSSRRGAR